MRRRSIEDPGMRESLETRARGLGASRAVVVSVSRIPVEEAVAALCRRPRCPGYGQSANCPPHTLTPEMARPWIRSFDRALVFKKDVPPAQLLSETRNERFREIYETAVALEAWAEAKWGFSAAALAAGSCKPVFCPDRPCASLTPSGTCRFPHLARPSMEALGINVFALARSVGWRIHFIGRDTDPAAVPSAMLAGMVLLAG